MTTTYTNQTNGELGAEAVAVASDLCGYLTELRRRLDDAAARLQDAQAARAKGRTMVAEERAHTLALRLRNLGGHTALEREERDGTGTPGRPPPDTSGWRPPIRNRACLAAALGAALDAPEGGHRLDCAIARSLDQVPRYDGDEYLERTPPFSTRLDAAIELFVWLGMGPVLGPVLTEAIATAEAVGDARPPTATTTGTRTWRSPSSGTRSGSPAPMPTTRYPPRPHAPPHR